jgi:vacuolar protein sorting-associated protein 13D
LEIKASSPIILLPLSSRSDSIIVADLGEFTLKNSFRFSNDQHIISVQRDPLGVVEILDVMSVKLFHTDLFAGRRCVKSTVEDKGSRLLADVCLDMGNYVVLKKGDGLLKHKCHLQLIVERNIDSWRTHNVPDISVHGTLSKLESVLDLQQYKLIRGFLAHNLGEDLDDLFVPNLDAVDSRLSLATIDTEKFKDSQVWKNLSIALDLQDVSVRLDLPRKSSDNGAKLIDHLLDNSALACINFIKSRLIIDSFSDGSQDIDLVSQEILILDSRTHDKPEQANVFTNILKPIHSRARDDIVQAEVHSRKRRDHTKYTILLNDMRVMAVLDWLEAVKDFLAQSEDPPPVMGANSGDLLLVPVTATTSRSVSDINAQPEEDAVELKLNITDSEVVFVENTNQRDTNAIILKVSALLF